MTCSQPVALHIYMCEYSYSLGSVYVHIDVDTINQRSMLHTKPEQDSALQWSSHQQLALSRQTFASQGHGISQSSGLDSRACTTGLLNKGQTKFQLHSRMSKTQTPKLLNSKQSASKAHNPNQDKFDVTDLLRSCLQNQIVMVYSFSAKTNSNF